MENINIDTSIKKGLKFKWNRLVKSKNYLSPQSIAEFKNIDLINSSSFVVNGREYYFKNKTKTILNDFADKIYNIENIKEYVTYNTVYQKVINQIEKIGFKTNKTFEEILSNLIKDIRNNIKNYDFYWRIEGLEIIDNYSIKFNDSKIFIFDQNEFNNIMDYLNGTNPKFDESVKKKINNDFFNEVCIKVNSYGDYNYAKNEALNQANTIINILRFIFCFYYSKYVPFNRFKINLASDSSRDKNDSISINNDENSVKLNFESNTSLKQKFKINKKIISDFRKYYFLDEFISILTKDNKNEIETAISNAIYWIGEAQNIEIKNISFFNFWTAIESLTYNPPGNKGITKAIKNSVSAILISGGYKFYKPDEYKNLRKKVEELYDKRSKIVHRGKLENIDNDDLVSICKISTRLVLELIGLSAVKGYSNFNLVKENSDRLNKIYKTIDE